LDNLQREECHVLDRSHRKEEHAQSHLANVRMSKLSAHGYMCWELAKTKAEFFQIPQLFSYSHPGYVSSYLFVGAPGGKGIVACGPEPLPIDESVVRF
jgi:hypothetical protein